MEDKNFTTFEEQINILKKRNLKFVSEEMAMKALQRFGYYSIINGYKDPYIEVVDGKEYYRDGTTFEQIYSLYTLDRRIRNELMNAMLEVEDNLRTAVAHTLAKAFTAKQSAYLNRENFNLGRKRKTGYQLDDILKKFNKIANDDVQPIKHYRDTYGNIPPWILLKGASFGNLINFIKLQKSPQKDEIISLIYDFPINLARVQDVKNLFMDTLFICLDFRNRAAHGGRIYNYTTNSEFRYSPILHRSLDISEADYRNGKGKTGIIPLTEALEYMDNKNPYLTIMGGTTFWVKKHCEMYPEDRDYLQNYLMIKRPPISIKE